MIFGSKDENVKHPCRRCIYFYACGNAKRTKPCSMRRTKKEAEERQSRMKGGE